MKTRSLTPSETLGVEAGIYVPPRVLGDAPPPPRSLRLAAVVVIAGSIGASVVAVNVVPDAAHTWHVVSHQTDRALAHVLGKAEVQTAELLSDLTAGLIPVAEPVVIPPLH
ncbi:hypothetical protein GCM10007242_39670 [Pigmentiphaga litoralis]|jgi:hypothetical protein|uniref:hypothetical protein n=1 Tax=Pigmentiphaga litoralis TaxID=516702 RepID=UPI00167AB47D|nr:hypothetical protein [Pigmentiphaga litoralis]GGX29294.1 hypothetical protein GCM10007242_39670 [Pigmentiphaga litoralis]